MLLNKIISEGGWDFLNMVNRGHCQSEKCIRSRTSRLGLHNRSFPALVKSLFLSIHLIVEIKEPYGNLWLTIKCNFSIQSAAVMHFKDIERSEVVCMHVLDVHIHTGLCKYLNSFTCTCIIIIAHKGIVKLCFPSFNSFILRSIQTHLATLQQFSSNFPHLLLDSLSHFFCQILSNAVPLNEKHL